MYVWVTRTRYINIQYRYICVYVEFADKLAICTWTINVHLSSLYCTVVVGPIYFVQDREVPSACDDW